MKEIWKDIYFFNKPTNEWIDYRGLYQVSNFGRIRSLDRYVRGYNHGVEHKKLIRGKVLKCRTNHGDYYLAHLGKDSKHRDYSLHRLVYFSFNPDDDTLMQVNHINEDKSDNRLENLNLMSGKENSNWGTRVVRIKEKLTGVPKGPMSEENKRKISNSLKQSEKYKKGRGVAALKTSKRISQFTKNGDYIQDFISAAEAERVLKIHSQSINACCNLKRPSAGGYIWKFAN